ncbi:NAD-dependent deacylase [candidate division KSB1 bacterium]|nr:MAG: NAD-dependent deacylase [candidate division KSB1 bacterium]
MNYKKAAEIIRQAKYAIAFTGAGISVESGIPPFRGREGLWNRYNPECLEIHFFRAHPEVAWPVIKQIFYDFIAAAQPNAAHTGLAKLEQGGFLKTVITQNIDGLHRDAGSRSVLEFHGTSRRLVCMGCTKYYSIAETDFSFLPPTCRICGDILKPDLVFFSEPIPQQIYSRSLIAAEHADVVLIVGASGDVMPAAMIPRAAKEKGAVIIEINPQESNYTRDITDLYLEAPASVAMTRLLEAMHLSDTDIQE